MVLGEASLLATTSIFGIGFDTPLYMLASLPGALMVFFLVLRASRLRRRYVSLLGGRVSRGVLLVEASRILGLALLVLSAGAPYTVDVKYVEVKPGDIEALRSVGALHVILVDNSISMGYSEGLTKRIDVARDFIREYLLELNETERVEIYSFSSTTKLLCKGSPTDCMEYLDMLNASERYSAIGTALGAGISRMEAAKEPALVLLVTDGGNNYGPDPRDVARGIGQLFTDKSPIAIVKVGNDPRASVLEEVSGLAKGFLYDAGVSGGDVLDDLSEEVYTSVKYQALEARAETRIEVESKDYSIQWVFAVLGIALILASLVIYP